MRVRRKAVREGRVLLVVPDSGGLRIATGLRSAGWRVTALSRAYSEDDKPSRASVVGVLPTPVDSLGGCCFPDVLGPPEALLKAAYRDQRATASRAEDALTMSVAGDG